MQLFPQEKQTKTRTVQAEPNQNHKSTFPNFVALSETFRSNFQLRGSVIQTSYRLPPATQALSVSPSELVCFFSIFEQRDWSYALGVF